MLPDLYALVMAPLLRAFLLMLGTTTGVWMRFEKIQGDFFKYRVRLEGVTLEASKHFRCSAELCTLEFSILDASLDTLVVSNVCLEGARFEYNHVTHQDVIPQELPAFVIKQLTLRDSEVVFTDHTRGLPLAFKIYLEEYHCESLHSTSLLFDAIFTASLQGRLEKSPLTTAFRQVDQRCMAQWAIRDLPVRRLSRFVKGQLDLLEQSTLDLLVTHTWHTEEDTLTLQVQVWIRDLIKLRSVNLLPAGPQKLAKALNGFINQQVKTLPLSFHFKVRKANFLQLTHVDATAVLLAFSEALTQAILERSLQNYDQIRDMGRLGLNTLLDLKQIFDKY